MIGLSDSPITLKFIIWGPRVSYDISPIPVMSATQATSHEIHGSGSGFIGLAPLDLLVLPFVAGFDDVGVGVGVVLEKKRRVYE